VNARQLQNFPLIFGAALGLWSVANGQSVTEKDSAPYTSYLKKTDSQSPLPTIGITADNIEIPVTDAGVKISSETKRIIFKIGDPEAGATDPNAKRVQYKLDGVDLQWSERHGDMCITVSFYGKDGRVVGKKFFPLVGVSPGWEGSFKDSTFSSTRQTFVVPPDTTTLGVTVGSAGPPDALGLLVVKDLKVLRETDPNNPTVIVDSNKLADMSATPDKSAEWIRDGTNPGMATLLSSLGVGTENIFAIFDNDPLGHAEWHVVRDYQPAVYPGEKLVIQWEAIYSIGLGYMFYTTYGTLPPGHYRFRIKELDLMGNPLEGERGVDIEVPRPYWSNPWLWFAAATVLAGMIAVCFRLTIRAKMRRMYQENAVERERLRIAQDIHDDLGARLTHVSILSGFGRNHASAEVDQERFEKIATMTQDMVSSLYQTIWTVSPENDSLDSLVTFLCQLIHNLCDPAGISCRIQSNESFEQRLVTSETRHNITMAVRESVNNALKHSGANEIRFNLVYEKGTLSIQITDNGSGFDLESVDGGSGLANIRNRVEKIGGKVTIESRSGIGTVVSMKVPIA